MNLYVGDFDEDPPPQGFSILIFITFLYIILCVLIIINHVLSVDICYIERNYSIFIKITQKSIKIIIINIKRIQNDKILTYFSKFIYCYLTTQILSYEQIKQKSIYILKGSNIKLCKLFIYSTLSK